jgi:glycosyltransferase involved in cell wall biosynthesis
VNFIREAIEGFLMQETTFPVEILIHDDASTDGTADIVREYQAKYPQLIRTVLQAENQWSKGIKPGKFLEPLVRGEFVALCEGDDYWTSPQKLQKQVQLLEAHPNCSASIHGCKVIGVPEDRTSKEVSEQRGSDVLSFRQLEQVVCFYPAPTASLTFRTALSSGLGERVHGLAFGDWPLQIWLARQGPLLYSSESMSVYRLHAGGYWSTKEDAARERIAADTMLEVGRRFGPDIIGYCDIAASNLLAKACVASALSLHWKDAILDFVRILKLTRTVSFPDQLRRLKVAFKKHRKLQLGRPS